MDCGAKETGHGTGGRCSFSPAVSARSNRSAPQPQRQAFSSWRLIAVPWETRKFAWCRGVQDRLFARSIGVCRSRIGSEYSGYVRRALEDLQQAGTSDLVVIPFFLSDTDPVLQRVKASLPAYGYTRPITWAPPMADSYLIAQVVVDRAMALSQDPEHEQVMVLGFGATDAANERAMHSDLNKLVDYLSRYQRFRESRALV